jgi:hypothetical protein
LRTVTYGTSVAAIRTMIKLAEDEAQRFPIASQILKKDFYIDDLMSGSNSAKTPKTALSILGE